MRIAYSVYDFVKPGGIERYVREMASFMARAGHDVHVFTTTAPENPDLTAPGIKFHILGVSGLLPGFLKLHAFDIAMKKALFSERFDIIHSQGTDNTTHNVITAHSCHAAWVRLSRKVSLWEWAKKTLHPLHPVVVARERANFTSGSRIIAISRVVQKEVMENHPVKEEDFTLIRLGVDLKRFNPQNRQSSHQTRKLLGISSDSFVVLFVSNEFRRKGLSVLVSALAKTDFPDITLLTVGRGSSRPYLEMARQKGFAGKMVFVPQTSEVERYFALADLFVLPTRHEAFGLVIVEAMASGLPVLVSRLAGASELIDDDRYLLDDPLNAGVISDKIRFFLENRTGLTQMGLRCRAMVENLTWESTGQNTLRLYEETVKNGS